ncbi:hypothetical protein [uncultured Shewanella sp.]|uniref:hypothetical protein n=1 Tax=uncultured Shewanella sp. TaxID=173975 RepID=UPI002612548E|nr:hypothetical protein [uncultured Shewanella sp.]
MIKFKYRVLPLIAISFILISQVSFAETYQHADSFEPFTVEYDAEIDFKVVKQLALQVRCDRKLVLG